MYSFPQGQRASKFTKLKGVFLACSSVSRVILGSEPEIFAFQVAPDPKQRGAKESAINTVKVLPILDPANPKDMERCFKASFKGIKREKVEVVIVLPFQFPDGMLLNAATEARRALSQLCRPGFAEVLDQYQLHKAQKVDITQDLLEQYMSVTKRLNLVFTDIFYQMTALEATR